MSSSCNGASRRLEHQLKQSSLSSKHEGIRLHEKANRVSAQSKRLRDQLDQLERKAKRLRCNATEAIRLHQSLEFEALCLALRRNDSSTTAIEATEKFPNGYAQPLGDALDKNKHVSSIEICMDTSIPSLITDEAYGNSETSGDNNSMRAEKYVAKLIKFLQSSKSLRRVKIFSSFSLTTVTPQLINGVGEGYLAACLQNPKVEELEVCDLDEIYASSFQDCTEHSSLKKLRIRFKGNNNFPSGDRQAIVDAFRSSSSLLNLDLECYDLELAESILATLQTRDSLEELKLDLNCQGGVPRLWSTLSALLHASSRMKHLILAYAAFDFHTMQELINGLRRPGPTLSLTVQELSLTDCSFESDVNGLLIEFMQTRAAPVDTLARAPVLRKLTLTSFENGGNDWLPEEIVSMLCVQRDLSSSSTQQVPAAKSNDNQESCYYSTIGSQIESLTLGPIDEEYSDLFEVVAEHAHLIRLQAIEVSTIHQVNDVAALANCITKIESLRAVDIRDVSVSAHPLLASLRANGTIQSASMQCSVAKEITAKLARAYAERNQHLDGLLLESSTCSEQESTKDANRSTARLVDQHGDVKKKSFGPTLLAAAQQVPRTEASKLLRSFLSLRESVGWK